MSREPERTCAVCREAGAPDTMVRLAAFEGQVVVDMRARFPGRGVWVHLGCCAPSPKLSGRLRSELEATVPADLEAQITEGWKHELRSGLSTAASAGAVLSGFETLRVLLPRGGVACVLVASDASEATIGRIRRHTEAEFVQVPLTMEEIGGAIGRGAVAAAAIRVAPASGWLLRQLRRSVQRG
jgi:predicted RNA-binding protein YlxR (DUF448 family)